MYTIPLLLFSMLIPATSLVAQERRFSSSDAADAAERLSGRRSHMDASIRLIAGTRLEGLAITMQLVRDDSASLLEEGLKAIKIFEGAPPASVIVVCLDGEKNYAVFGPTFATLARSRRLAGIVTDGAMRGVADLRRIGVAVYSRGTVPGSAGAHYRLHSVNQQVTCGGARVSSGDLIVGDADGVAVVPRESIVSARTMAQRLREEKEQLLPLITKRASYTRAVEDLKAKREQYAKPKHR